MIKRILSLGICLFSFVVILSQNDLDAIRYSRTGVGGSPRFVAMGGAFGALGADVSCASYNPAGLGVFRKGEMIYSGGLKFTNSTSNFEGKSASALATNFIYSNFGLAYTTPSNNDPSKRNTFCFTNTQLQNFDNTIQIANGSTRSSISGDMVSQANKAQSLNQLDPSYELMGYNSYLLDYDSAAGKFFSFVDPKRNVNLNRTIATTGRMNELNFSFAQSVNDKFYFGISLGIPRIKYESTTTHSEADSNDSMRITVNPDNTYSSTYVDGLPFFYTDKLGFNSLTYTEHFITQGYGLNLKFGGIVRVNSNLRLGGYIHTPTIFYLTDTYNNSMSVSFDANPTVPVQVQYPDNVGKYDYKIITPMKYGINGAYIINKSGTVSMDIENINYSKASLTSTTPTDFAGVDAVIKSKYKSAVNLRLGGEVVKGRAMFRAGYALYGSPFGGFLSGMFDRQTVSLGLGLRTKGSFFFDLAWTKTFTSEKYYMYSPSTPVKTDLNLMSTSFIASIGLKFQ